MPAHCRECGVQTLWEDSLGSSICTGCGTLADPSQHVLASHLESYDNTTRDYYAWDAGNPTLKSIRNKNGWALSGQGKEVRDKQNTFAIHAFINTLSQQLSHPGVSIRAQNIFDRAMKRGNYRWGRKAKLTAGASVAIALRESHKSDSLRDIAILLEDSSISLSRAFNSVVTLLQLDLASSDPGVHLTTLQTHLIHLISPPDSSSEGDGVPILPKSLISVIKSLRPRFANVMKTAHSLSALVTQIGTLTHLPTPSTACAILLLSLEGEYRSSLPNCGALAQALGSRFGAGKGVVMQRYRVIYEIIEGWIKEVPWLDGYEVKGGKAPRGKPGKTGKRVVVSKGLKDVIQFQDEIWRKRVEDMGKIDVYLEQDENEKENWSDDDVADEKPEVRKKRKDISQDHSVPFSDARPCKLTKTRHTRTMEDALQFLLNPAISFRCDPDDGLLAHLLASDVSTLSHAFACPPTRLQMLAVSRAGGEEFITDEELFDEGELDGLLRSQEEVDVYAEMVDWDRIEEEREHRRSERMEQRARGRRKREAHEKGHTRVEGGTKRIDMEALKRLMDLSDSLEDGSEGKDDDPCFYFDHGGAELRGEGEYWDEEKEDGIEEVEEEWRPMTPSGGSLVDLDRYDI